MWTSDVLALLMCAVLQAARGRSLQSAQSVPSAQRLLIEPGPPSLHWPSLASEGTEQALLHTPGAYGGGTAGGGARGGDGGVGGKGGAR